MAGPIPTEIGQCSQLKHLALQINYLATGSWHFVIVLIDGKRVYHCVVGFADPVAEADAAEFTTFMTTKVPKCSVQI